MKLKNTPILLIPLLLLSTLAACDTNNNNNSNETVDNIIVKAIDGAVVGDVIDLAEMVTIEGGNQVFTCELLTEDTASIDGTKVTILKEGVVDILVASGDKERSITFNAFSKEKYAYNKYANSVGEEFFLGVVDNSSTGTYLTSDGWLFGEEFTVYSNKALNNSGYGFEGYYFAGASVYSFSMDNETGENFKYGPGAVSGLYYSKNSFTMSTSLFTTGEDGTLEGGAEAAESMLSMLGYRSDLFEYYLELLNSYYQSVGNDVNFVFKSKGVLAMMYDMKNTSGELVASFPIYNLYCTYDETTTGVENGTLSWGTYYLRAEEDYIQNSELYKTVTKELQNTPEAVVPEKFDERITSISNSKNYTMTIKSGWYDSSNFNTAKPIATPNLTLDGGATIYEEIRSEYMAETNETTYVNNEEALYTKNVKDNNEDKVVYDHLTKGESNISKVTNYTVSNNVYSVVSPVTSSVDGSTLWNKENKLIDFLADENLSSKASRNLIYSEEYDKDEEADYNYVFNGAAGGYAYLISLLSMSHFSGDIWSGLNFGLSYTDGNTYSVFEALNLNAFVYMTDDTTTINFKFGWTTSQYYHIVIEFSNVGTTVIPTL